MARLGLADVQVSSRRFDEAIRTFREFVAQPGDLPIDGLLMQLGRAYRLAGKRVEALQAFNRIIQEFPQSLYIAEARRQADALRAAGSASS
jgi:tetratricopeptide (TPR) repeat protein